MHYAFCILHFNLGEVINMLDIRKIRENPEAIKAGLKAKEVDCDAIIDRIVELDVQVRALKTTSEGRTAQKNKLAKENDKLFGMKKGLEKKGESTAEVDAKIEANKAEAIAIDAANEADTKLLKELNTEYTTCMLSLPNMPDADLLPGGKENNQPLRYIGEKHSFDFEPKHHVTLCENLGMIDYERGVKLAGSGNWMYTGMGARLEWALLNYFIDTHTADGYDFILPPHMLEYQCGLTAGQFPKFADEVFKIANHPTEGGTFYMLPTAEAALASVYRDEILTAADLPKKFFAYTPCFRREAGSGHADERGMVRGHQFNKVEMFQFTTPEGSDEAFEELVKKAENLVAGLGLHFRTVKLAAGDCSASMARTYDIEILIPSMNGYKEVSSVSNARDYQARRGNIRYRREDGKIDFVHTLNGSGLATSRIFPAIVEQNQRADGSVVVPEVLRKYLGGIEVITKK